MGIDDSNFSESVIRHIRAFDALALSSIAWQGSDALKCKA
nr:hypothetical protein [uncultured bacterium]